MTHDPLCYRTHDKPLGRDPLCQCAALRAREQRVRGEVVSALVNAQVDYFRLIVKHYPNITVAYEMLIDRAQGDR